MSGGEVIGIDTHPGFDGEEIARARGRLRKLACEVPPRAVADLLRRAEAATGGAVVDLAAERDRRQAADTDLRAALGVAMWRAPVHVVEQVANILRAEGVRIPGP